MTTEQSFSNALAPDPPTAVRQCTLDLRLHQRTMLLTMEMVRAVRGTDADTVTNAVDAGKLRWVWNVAVRPREVRELRFLAREIAAGWACRLTPEHAVAIVAGDRARYQSSEICQLLFVSRPTLNRLFEAGELSYEVRGRKRWVTRANLAEFLMRRLQGRARRTAAFPYRTPLKPCPGIPSLQHSHPNL